MVRKSLICTNNILILAATNLLVVRTSQTENEPPMVTGGYSSFV